MKSEICPEVAAHERVTLLTAGDHSQRTFGAFTASDTLRAGKREIKFVERLPGGFVKGIDAQSQEAVYGLFFNRGHLFVHAPTLHEKKPFYLVLYSDTLKFINYAVSKNAQTSLLKIILNASSYATPETAKMGNKVWVYSKEHCKELCQSTFDLIVPKLAHPLQEYTKFIVYRDPIDRFVSLCNFILLRGFSSPWYNIKDQYVLRGALGRYLRLRKLTKSDIHDHIDNMLTLTRAVNATPEFQDATDGHTRSQWAFFSRIQPGQLDYIVYLKDMRDFMQNVIHTQAYNPENVNQGKLLTKADFTPEQLAQAEAIFADDYRIVREHKDLIYVPGK